MLDSTYTLLYNIPMLDALSLLAYCVFVFLIGLTFTFTYLTIRDDRDWETRRESASNIWILYTCLSVLSRHFQRNF